VYGYLIPTQGETQIILLIDAKIYLIQWFFKVGDIYPPFGPTAYLFQENKLPTLSSLYFQDNSNDMGFKNFAVWNLPPFRVPQDTPQLTDEQAAAQPSQRIIQK
jgi:hypothetical protein